MMKNKDIVIDREKKLILLGWLKNGLINGEELHRLHSASEGWRELSMEEARALLRMIEESY